MTTWDSKQDEQSEKVYQTPFHVTFPTPRQSPVSEMKIKSYCSNPQWPTVPEELVFVLLWAVLAICASSTKACAVWELRVHPGIPDGKGLLTPQDCSPLHILMQCAVGPSQLMWQRCPCHSSQSEELISDNGMDYFAANSSSKGRNACWKSAPPLHRFLSRKTT